MTNRAKVNISKRPCVVTHVILIGKCQTTTQHFLWHLSKLGTLTLLQTLVLSDRSMNISLLVVKLLVAVI